MNNIKGQSIDLSYEEVTAAVKEYLDSGSFQTEHEDDVSFWSVNEDLAVDVEQESDDATV